MTQGNLDAGDSAERVNNNIELNQSVSEDYNKMSADERKEVFSQMTNSDSSTGSEGFSDLVITGVDTDGDGNDDELGDVWNAKTGEDLYNRPGERSNSNTAVEARFDKMGNSLDKAQEVDSGGNSGAEKQKAVMKDMLSLKADGKLENIDFLDENGEKITDPEKSDEISKVVLNKENGQTSTLFDKTNDDPLDPKRNKGLAYNNTKYWGEVIDKSDNNEYAGKSYTSHLKDNGIGAFARVGYMVNAPFHNDKVYEYEGLEPTEIEALKKHKEWKAEADPIKKFNHWAVKTAFDAKENGQATDENGFGEHTPLTKNKLEKILDGEDLDTSAREGLEFVRDNFDRFATNGEITDRKSMFNEWEQRVNGSHVMVNPEAYLFNTQVDDSLVEEGKRVAGLGDDARPGILNGKGPEGAIKFKEWLDSKIPDDGTNESDDRRTALVIKLALADAATRTDNPTQQLNQAYVHLNTMRHMFQGPDVGNEEMNEGTWDNMDDATKEKWREVGKLKLSSEPALANAEHFFETAHRVAGVPFDGGPYSNSILRGPDSATAWKGISKTYNIGKRVGLIGGSQSENQHKWEDQGRYYGKAAFDMTDQFNEGTSMWRVLSQAKHYAFTPKIREE